MKRTFRKGRNVLKRSQLSRRYGGRNIKNKNRLKDNLRKLGICIVVVLMVLIIKNLDFRLTQRATDSIKAIVTREFNFREGFASIKDIFPAVKNRVQNVFSDSNREYTMIPPVEGVVTSGYGMRVHPVFNTEKKHEGIDIGAAVGSEVKAALEGDVEEVRRDDYYGHVVIIDHGGGIKTLYGHMGEINVIAGQKVVQGELIGTVGNTGMSTGSHLHFEVWKNGKTVDPANEIDFVTKGM